MTKSSRRKRPVALLLLLTGCAGMPGARVISGRARPEARTSAGWTGRGVVLPCASLVEAAPPVPGAGIGLLGAADGSSGRDTGKDTDEDADKAPDASGVEAVEAVPTGGVGGRSFGARTGIIVPAAAGNEAYSTAFTLGGFYARELPPRFARALGAGSTSFEAGLDFAWTTSDDGRTDARLCALRFDLVFPRSQVGAGPPVYLLGGYQVLIASPETDGERRDTEYVSGLDIGVGLGPTASRLDARAVYSFLAGSGNVKGVFSLTGGVRF